MKRRRLSQIFARDGNSITLALDGYFFSTKTGGIDEVIKNIPDLVENGLDAVIVTYGMAKNHAEVFSELGLIVRADLSTSIFEQSVPGITELLSVKDALKVGADSVVSMTFPGSEQEVNSHRIAWDLAREGDKWNVPFMCETLPFSYHVTNEDSNRIEKIALAARLGTEIGADIIKTRLTGHERDIEIIEAAQKPVLVLGGPETKEIYEYFKYVKHCMAVGAKGVAVGRKITLNTSPVGVVAALNTIIHKDGTPEEALDVYESFLN